MKVTEFSEKTKRDHIPAPWESELGKDDFVSYMPSYRGGAYLDLFSEIHTPQETVGEMTSYLYDPVENGADAEKSYPLIVFLHGATNALAGKICVMHSGCELYASPKYQAELGGAFLLVPLANEKRDENGELIDSWSESYLEPLYKIIMEIKQNHNISKVIVTGGSSGGVMSWMMAETYTDLVDVCIPISSGYTPNEETLRRLDASGMQILVGHGRHDELCAFAESVAPKEKVLAELKNCHCYFPDWVRNGDHGVASLNFGFEMGQHCLINQVQANLMFDDGTPYDAALPNGLTAWIREAASKSRG